MLLGIVLLGGCDLILPYQNNAPREAGVKDSGRTTDVDNGAVTDGSPPGAWCHGDWPFRKPLTIQRPQKDLLDFPVLIALDDPDLASHARQDGADICFCAAGGARLAREIESYDGAKGQLRAWVKVPRLRADAETVIHVYYGNGATSCPASPADVWSNGYLGVWHFHTPPPALVDSTTNAHDGTAQGQMDSSAQVDGMIGKAYHFDGVNDMVLAKDATVKPTGAFTVSAWFRIDPKDTNYDDDELVSTQGGPGDRGWDLSFDEDNTYLPCRAVSFRASYDGGQYGASLGWDKVCPDDSWYHVAGVFAPGTYLRFFVDGAKTDEATQGVPAALHASAVPLTIGAEANTAGGRNYFMGEIDEVRISSVAREPEWLAACHANQRSPATFVVPGAQQQRP